MPIDLYGNPENIRTYLYSKDAAEFIRQVADNAPNGEIVNVAHSEPVTLQQVVDAIKLHTSSVSEVRTLTQHYTDREIARDVPNRLADTTRLKELTSHTPMPFYEGLAATITRYNTLRDDWHYSRLARYYV